MIASAWSLLLDTGHRLYAFHCSVFMQGLLAACRTDLHVHIYAAVHHLVCEVGGEV